MVEITFNAFSFLKKKFEEKGIKCSNNLMKIPDNINVDELIEHLGFQKDDVEAVFINYKILSKNTILKNGDRVALVPPGGIPNHVAAYIGKGK